MAIEEDEVGGDDESVLFVVFRESGDDGWDRVCDDGVHRLNGLVDYAELVVEVVEVGGMGHGGGVGCWRCSCEEVFRGVEEQMKLVFN